jgi:hypothetical protein
MIRGTLSIAAAMLFVSSSALAQAQQSQNQPSKQDSTQSQAQGQTQSQQLQKQTSDSLLVQVSPNPVPKTPEAAQSGESLADAARKAREQKKDESKTPKVWDNDSLSAMGPLTNASLAQTSNTSDSDKNAAKSNTPSGGDEATWRKKFSDAHDKLDKDQQDLTLLQRELGDLSVQYYTDPTKGMQQGYSQSDLTNQRAKIDDKQKEVDADKQAISDLEEELRQAGGDPGWAR